MRILFSLQPVCLSLAMLATLMQTVKADDLHDITLYMQAVMHRDGFYSGKLDGRCGPQTMKSAQKYLRSLGTESGLKKSNEETPCNEIWDYVSEVDNGEALNIATQLGLPVTTPESFQAMQETCDFKAVKFPNGFVGPSLVPNTRHMFKVKIVEIKGGIKAGNFSSKGLKAAELTIDDLECIVSFFNEYFK